MQPYSRIKEGDRYQIQAYLRAGLSKSQIAEKLGFHRSAIGREVNKACGVYWAEQHQHRAQLAASRRRGPGKLDSNEELLGYVMEKLKLRWSPEQIARTLKKENPDQLNRRVSHETIYTYIYLLARGEMKKELMSYLRQGRKARRKRGAKPREAPDKIPDLISIEERPAQVADRSIAGHWEADLIVGKGHKSVLGSIVERKTRAVILVPLKSKDATVVRKAFEKELLKMPEQMRQTLTYDRGLEMAEHKLFTKNTKMKVYFCHPASPWERGTNENTNMLIRDFFPKGTDFNQLTRAQIKHVQDLLNERPRKTLDWECPKAVFEKEILNRSGIQ